MCYEADFGLPVRSITTSTLQPVMWELPGPWAPDSNQLVRACFMEELLKVKVLGPKTPNASIIYMGSQ